MLQHLAKVRLPTKLGEFTLHLFAFGGLEIPVLTQLEKVEDFPVLRIHSSCMTGDVFHSLRCDCGAQLERAMQEIQARGGLLIYLPQEGRGIGLVNKLKAYALQDQQSLDTVEANLQLGLPADARDYTPASAVLDFFKIRQCIALTNNPLKIEALQAHGLYVKREALRVAANPENESYLNTKLEKMGHFL